MSEANDGFGAGFGACLIVLLLLFLGYLVGYAVMVGWTSSDCKNFGKTQIRQEWFECKPIPEKK